MRNALSIFSSRAHARQHRKAACYLPATVPADRSPGLERAFRLYRAQIGRKTEPEKPGTKQDKGGLNTKLHVITDQNGRPLSFFIPVGQISDDAGEVDPSVRTVW